jgi:hypothetical protein
MERQCHLISVDVDLYSRSGSVSPLAFSPSVLCWLLNVHFSEVIGVVIEWCTPIFMVIIPTVDNIGRGEVKTMFNIY